MERPLEGLMVSHLNFSVRKALANKLDPDTVQGNDWRMLADKLKYSYEDILNLQVRQVQHGSNTMKLLEDYGLTRGSTLEKLWTELKTISRPDAIEVIEKFLPEIRETYEAERSRREQNTDSNSSTCTCYGTPHGYPSATSCHRGYSHVGGCQHSAYVGHDRSGYAGQDHSGYIVQDHCSSPHPSHRSCTCGIRSFKGIESYPAASPACHLTTTHNCCQHSTARQGVARSELPHYHVSQRPQQSEVMGRPATPRQSSSPVVQPPLYRSVEDNANPSMVVFAGTHVHSCKEDMMDVDVNDGQRFQEQPAAIDEVLLRHMAFREDNVPSLLSAQGMEVAAEEEVCTSSDSSNNTNSSNQGQGLVFQNPTQVWNIRQEPKQLPVQHAHVGSRPGYPSASRTHGHTGITNGDVYLAQSPRTDKPDHYRQTYPNKNNHGAANNLYGWESGRLHDPHSDHCSMQQTKILNEEKKVINTDYNLDMKEEKSSQRHDRQGPNVQSQSDSDKPYVTTEAKVHHGVSLREREVIPTTDELHGISVLRREKSKSDPVPGASSTVSNGPISSQHCVFRAGGNRRATGGSKGATLAGTGKSTSTPKMKLSEFGTGSRQVRVFVTYAADSDRHEKRVLNMCDCLVKNGFSCRIDVYEKHLMNGNWRAWYETRFRKADFVLLCISPMYKLQTESENGRSGAIVNMDATDCNHGDEDGSLHTAYIYGLLQNEFAQNGYRNRRFVPLVFPGATRDHVPNWLKNTLIYCWPNQYKDLLWMMTKPQEKICSQNSAV